MQAGVELFIRDLGAFEVLRQHLVVRLRRGLEELVAPRRHLVGHAGRDRDLDVLGAVPPPCRPMDEIDVSLERFGRPDRELEWRDLVPEDGPELIERLPSDLRSPDRTLLMKKRPRGRSIGSG